MRATLRSVLLLLLVSSTFTTQAQWLKMIESSDNLYKDAKREIELKHYQKAINMCNKGIAISPRNLDIHLLLGSAYSLAGKLDSARIELNYVIQKNPKYRDAYIYLVNMEASACNYLQALEYADMGLKYFPNDRDLLLKKLDIYIKEGDWIESNKLAEYLFEKFSTDAYIRSVYLEYKLTLARQYSHQGYIDIARRAYEAVLEQDPMNKEALQAIYALDVRSGNYEASLAATNRALQSTPNSYEFLLKKIGILEAMSRYLEAIELAEKLVRLYPTSSEIQRQAIYLRMEAGRYYMNADPYIQFGAVLEKEPNNRDALNYEINIAFSRGLTLDALKWINFGLRYHPGDRELLMKKMGVLEELKRYSAASDIAEVILRSSPSATNRSGFVELRLLSARQFMNELAYDSAIVALNSVLYYDRSNMQATMYLINVYLQNKRYDDALRAADDALAYYPADEQLLFKKSVILYEYQRYADAAAISKALVEKHPENKQYLGALIEQSLAAGRQSMQFDDYHNTLITLHEVLDRQPGNVDALNYIINVYSSIRKYDSALYYADQGIHYYPDSKEFLFRKALVYADAQQYQTAYSITGELFSQYPYNARYRSAYIDELLGSGRQYIVYNQPDSALIEFYKAIDIAPNDTPTMFCTINLLYDMKQYDTALAIIDRGRRFYPTNPFFLRKKAEVLEGMKLYDEAWRNADTLAKMYPEFRYRDYAQHLFARRLRNEIGLFYLHSKIVDASNIIKINSLATAQYTRYHSKGTLTFRINYAGRNTGTGFQGEAEAYYSHNKAWYSYIVAAYSPVGDSVFPRIRVGYSISHSLDKGYTVEVGGRYLSLTNGSVISPTAALSRELGDFYLTLRGYYMITNINSTASTDAFHKNYMSILFSARYFLRDDHTEHFTASAGYGTAPDDFSINYATLQNVAFKSVSVGVAYQRQIAYLTTFGIAGTWYNQRQSETNYKNQWDVSLTLLRKF